MIPLFKWKIYFQGALSVANHENPLCAVEFRRISSASSDQGPRSSPSFLSLVSHNPHLVMKPPAMSPVVCLPRFEGGGVVLSPWRGTPGAWRRGALSQSNLISTSGGGAVLVFPSDDSVAIIFSRKITWLFAVWGYTYTITGLHN